MPMVGRRSRDRPSAIDVAPPRGMENLVGGALVRGADGRIYAWGDEWHGTRLNHCDETCAQAYHGATARDKTVDDGWPRTAPVGFYPEGASPYGLVDMAGNAIEWVAPLDEGDCYDSAWF